MAVPERVDEADSPPSRESGPDDTLGDALRRAQAGHEDGFVVLWRTLQPPLLRYLTVRGEVAPDDIAADTWLHVVRDLSRFRGGPPEFRAWLFTIARNRAVDQGRARAARPDVSVAELDAGETVPSAEVDALGEMSTYAACRMVASLPTDQAEMVMLRVVVGLDVGQVARIVGKRPGTVRVAVHRALRTLADRYRTEMER